MTMHAAANPAGLDHPAVLAGSLAGESAGAIRLPRGLPGFASVRSFRLEPPVAAGVPFMRLHSTEQERLGFMVLPVPAELRFLAEADSAVVCRELGIDGDNLLLLLMVTLEPGPTGIAAFANLRAPLFVDTERRLGWQVVLPARDYPIRYPLQGPR